MVRVQHLLLRVLLLLRLLLQLLRDLQQFKRRPNRKYRLSRALWPRAHPHQFYLSLQASLCP